MVASFFVKCAAPHLGKTFEAVVTGSIILTLEFGSGFIFYSLRIMKFAGTSQISSAFLHIGETVQLCVYRKYLD